MHRPPREGSRRAGVRLETFYWSFRLFSYLVSLLIVSRRKAAKKQWVYEGHLLITSRLNGCGCTRAAGPCGDFCAANLTNFQHLAQPAAIAGQRPVQNPELYVRPVVAGL